MTRSYKYRVYPTHAQELALLHALRCHRQLYNAALHQRIAAYKGVAPATLPSIITDRKRTNWQRIALRERERASVLLPTGGACSAALAIRPNLLWGGVAPVSLPEAPKKFVRKNAKPQKEGAKQILGFVQSVQVKLVKALPEYVALSSNALGRTLRRLDKAYAAFFKGGGFPRFRSGRNFRSIESGINEGARISPEGLTIQAVPGVVAVEWHRPIPETAIPKQVVVTVAPSGKWFACVQIEMPDMALVEHTGTTVGIDVGICHIVLTDGEIFDVLRPLQHWLRKLRIADRRVTRRKPKPGQQGSKGYREALAIRARVHERVANARGDAHHKLTRALVIKYATLAVEKLNIKGMLEEKTVEGWRGRVSDLHRAIADSAWYDWRQKLAYKAEETGCRIIEVDPANTTRECSRCGEVVPHAVWARDYRCPECGHTEYRKANAARNILARAMA